MGLSSGPRAVVTGAGSGLGRALCLALARRRARIVVSDIDLASAEETVKQVVAAGSEACARRCDVAQRAEVEALAVFAEERFGGTDLLVNNAGVAVAGPTGEVPLSDWEWVININLWGVIYGCHSFVPRLKAQRSGHILNVASAAGLFCGPDTAPYNVTKAGVIALSETLHGELSPLGIGVTVACPTFFTTNILAASRATSEAGEQFVDFARKFMKLSTVDSSAVAEHALRSCERGQLYSLPMSEGRWGWRAKRWAPESFYKRLLPSVLKSGREYPG
jgi:NAD(P)-dependent dehydrogenase (short-subunit alcohol dehydrogenase family)